MILNNFWSQFWDFTSNIDQNLKMKFSLGSSIDLVFEK
jgi:hypothetical protein